MHPISVEACSLRTEFTTLGVDLILEGLHFPKKQTGSHRNCFPLQKQYKEQRWMQPHLSSCLFPVIIMPISCLYLAHLPGCVAQSVGHLTRKSGVLGSIPGLATYFRFSFRFFKKGSCQLLAKVCARSTG